MVLITARRQLHIYLIAMLMLLSACNLTGAPRETSTPAARTPTLTRESSLSTTAETPDATTAASPDVTNPAATDAAPLSATQASGSPPSASNAVIASPVVGAVVSGTPLEINGVVSGLAEDRFWLELVDDQGNVINRQEITLRNPSRAREINWSASLFTRYTGEGQLRLIARDRSGREYVGTSVSIIVASESGAASLPTTTVPLATIINPAPGSTVQGETIQISGTAGGLFEAAFTLELVSVNGTVITSQAITLTSSDPSFVVPWSAVLDSGGYRGLVEIRAYYQQASDGQAVTLASVTVTLE